MAAVASSAVTVNETWKGGGTSARKYLYKDVTIVLSSQGGLTNNVPASLFGMTKIKGAMGFRDSSSVTVSAGPSYDEAYLVFYTIETNGNPADKSATYRGVVFGYDD